RLAIGDGRRRLERRARVARGALLHQAPEKSRVLRARLQAPRALYLLELDAAPGVLLLELLERGADLLARRARVLRKHLRHALERERLSRDQQRRLDDVLELVGVLAHQAAFT